MGHEGAVQHEAQGLRPSHPGSAVLAPVHRSFGSSGRMPLSGVTWALASLEWACEALAEAVVERPALPPQTPHASPSSPPGWTPMLQKLGLAAEASSSAVWTVTPQPSCGCSTGTM